METTRGILFRLCSVVCFVVIFAMIKATSDTVPARQAVFYRSAFALPLIIGWMAIRSDVSIGLKVKSRFSHFWRSIFGTGALSLNFAAIGYLPLPEKTAIGYAAPLLTVAFAALIIGESLRIFRISAVALGLLGVMVIVEPRLTVINDASADKRVAIGVCLVLAAAVFSALAQIQIRLLVQNEHPTAIAFYFAVTSKCLSLFSAPFEYASIIFALLIGYFVFYEVVNGQMLIGVSIVICAGVIIIWREAQLGSERSKENVLKPPLH